MIVEFNLNGQTTRLECDPGRRAKCLGSQSGSGQAATLATSGGSR